ncbi:uncharacterized protein LOC117114054 [Anneissia japonica]|uniref:uncharacterized protein LOC117114054 n=1 Tax=Anneissia japonica TaxID=1529436 RepID=UPI001425A763|nr:uncharacterized protein LOC117114054 [Anneissia japonica]
MLYFTCICVTFSLICGGFGCPNFQYQWSQYTVGLIDHEQNQSWLDAKYICESSRGYLASITTTDEVAAVLGYMRMNYTDGRYAIGLSRQANLSQDISLPANWKWETGEDFYANIQWDSNQPNINNTLQAGVRIDIKTSKILDMRANNPIKNKNTKGYICEFDSLYFQSTEPRGVITNASYIRCALRCLRQKECRGFHLDDAGCQIKTGLNGDPKRHYSKVIYRNE